MIILDTNVLSEAAKPVPSQVVMAWLAAQEPTLLFITAITQGELFLGTELLPVGKRRLRVKAAVDQMLREQFGGRILSFDESAAPEYATIAAARIATGRPTSQSDAMIAAIARAHRAAVATRNVSDFENCGISVINPWTA